MKKTQLYSLTRDNNFWIVTESGHWLHTASGDTGEYGGFYRDDWAGYTKRMSKLRGLLLVGLKIENFPSKEQKDEN